MFSWGFCTIVTKGTLTVRSPRVEPHNRLIDGGADAAAGGNDVEDAITPDA